MARFIPSLLLAAGLAAACGDNPTQPSGGSLTITCPAGLILPTGDGNPVAGTFALPQVSGGTAPLITTCDRQSGSSFPLGSTQVSCTVRDARPISAACSFAVTVVKVPVIAATRFLAFGDSITEGQIDTPCGTALTFSSYLKVLRSLQPIFDPGGVYPAKLEVLLNGRYLAQSIRVLNAGKGGEPTYDGAARLPGELASNAANALILLEGVNDLSSVDTIGPSATIASIVAGLRTMIRAGRQRSIPVFVGTLLPERPSTPPCRGLTASYIPDTNAAIRPMVAAEGATLVDLYTAFGGVPGNLIGPDGLHPTDAGHQRIAETFFNAIRGQLER